MKSILIPIVALAIGVAAGYVAAPSKDVVDSPVEIEKPVAKRAKLELEDNSAEALRAQVRDLRRQLAEAKSNPADAGEEAEEMKIDDDRRHRQPQSRKEFFEQMKKERPEAYASMTNHMAQMAQRRIENAQTKLDFFSSIDLSGMSAEDREKTERLQNLLVKREDLFSSTRMDDDISDEERSRKMREMWETDQEVRALNDQVRTALIRQTASAIGLTGSMAEDVVSTMSEIIEMTESDGRRPGRHRGGRGPGALNGNAR